MADLYSWADNDDFWDDDDTITDLMQLSDAELAKQCAAARGEKIKSIRQQALEGRKLSEKQRYCLAFWIAEHNPEFDD